MAKKPAQKSRPRIPGPKSKSAKTPRKVAARTRKAATQVTAAKSPPEEDRLLARARASLEAKKERDNAKLTSSPVIAGLLANGYPLSPRGACGCLDTGREEKCEGLSQKRVMQWTQSPSRLKGKDAGELL